MNVRELREMLQTLEAEGKGDTEVAFAYNYGDYWNTQVAATIDTVAPTEIEYSEYHGMNKVVECDEEDNEGTATEGVRTVILLS